MVDSTKFQQVVDMKLVQMSVARSCPQWSIFQIPGPSKKTAIDQKKLNMHWKPADQCFNAATHCFSKAGPNVVVSRQAVLSHNIEIGEPWAHGWLNVIARIQAGRLFFKNPVYVGKGSLELWVSTC